MRLSIFEKSENLGPTIYMELIKIVEASGIFEKLKNFTSQKKFKIKF